MHKLSNGREVQSPAWTIDAIRRHLLFTTNESGNSTVRFRKRRTCSLGLLGAGIRQLRDANVATHDHPPEQGAYSRAVRDAARVSRGVGGAPLDWRSGRGRPQGAVQLDRNADEMEEPRPRRAVR